MEALLILFAAVVLVAAGAVAWAKFGAKATADVAAVKATADADIAKATATVDAVKTDLGKL